MPFVTILWWGGLAFFAIRRNLASNERAGGVQWLLKQKREHAWFVPGAIVLGLFIAIGAALRITTLIEAFENTGGASWTVTGIGGMIAGATAATIDKE